MAASFSSLTWKRPGWTARHTVFGEVLSDSDDQAVVNAIEMGDSIDAVEVSPAREAVLEAQADRVSSWNAGAGLIPDQ